MNCVRKRLLILGLLMALIFSLSGCMTDDVIDIELLMDISEVIPGESYSFVTNVFVNEELVQDHDYDISIETGGEYAIIEGNTISINANAPIGQEILVKASFGEIITRYRLIVVKVPVTSIDLEANSNKAILDTYISLTSHIHPSNATHNQVQYIIIEGQDYVSLDNGTLYILRSAPLGEKIRIQVSIDDVLSNIIELEIDYIPVLSVTINEENEEETIVQGGTLNFVNGFYPSNATFIEPKYHLEGIGPYDIFIDQDTGRLDVSAQVPEGYQFSVYVIVDGVTSDYKTITVTQLTIEELILYSDKAAVEIGGVVQFSFEIIPYNALGINIAYEILEGASYGEFENSSLITKNFTPSGTVIKVVAYAYDDYGEIEGTRSNPICISVFKVDVLNVSLKTSDNIQMVGADETVIFGVDIYPANATDKIVSYQIIQGSSYAKIDMNTGVLTVFKNNNNEEVRVAAIVDGVPSNVVVVTTAMYYFDVSHANWNNFDISGNIFSNYRNIRLDLTEMASDANLTTVVVPNYVRRLEVEGAYSNVSPVVTTNLFFFFYNAIEIEIILKNVGIETTTYSNANIFDLPEGSNAKFIIEGLCYLRAGNAIDPYFYAVNGLYEPGDNNFEYRKHGMSGHNGANGGTAVMGYNVRFEGFGKIYLFGGNGANGTKGGNGANVPSQYSGGTAGNGGKGGSGGDSGFAIYGFNVAIHMMNTGVINASSGNAGKGGSGGVKGTSLPPGNHGLNGEEGFNGRVFQAIVAYNILSYSGGNVYESIGHISAAGWRVPEYETIEEIYTRMEKTYAVNMRIRNDFETVNKYYMTKLMNDNDILFMLRMIDNVLSKFPTNIFRELWRMTGNQVQILVVNEIERGQIAGLAGRNTNRIWLAHCRPAIRNIFYSDVENFAFHEIMHLLKYPIENRFSEATLKGMNNNYNYNINSSVHVYNPSNGYGKHNGYFLSAYSRTHWYEDVCETFSLIARLSEYYDFLDADAPIRAKMVYISTRLALGYGTCGTYKQEYWERLLS